MTNSKYGHSLSWTYQIGTDDYRLEYIYTYANFMKMVCIYLTEVLCIRVNLLYYNSNMNEWSMISLYSPSYSRENFWEFWSLDITYEKAKIDKSLEHWKDMAFIYDLTYLSSQGSVQTRGIYYRSTCISNQICRHIPAFVLCTSIICRHVFFLALALKTDLHTRTLSLFAICSHIGCMLFYVPGFN